MSRPPTHFAAVETVMLDHAVMSPSPTVWLVALLGPVSLHFGC